MKPWPPTLVDRGVIPPQTGRDSVEIGVLDQDAVERQLRLLKGFLGCVSAFVEAPVAYASELIEFFILGSGSSGPAWRRSF